MLIPSQARRDARTITSLSRRVNANSQQGRERHRARRQAYQEG